MQRVGFVGLVGTMSLAVVATSVTSCSQNDEVVPMGNTRATSVVNVSGLISTNTSWSAANEYHLDGKVYVTGGATLTIPAGTKIVGKYYAQPEKASALIVTRNGKINAVGTASNPIVMTAESGHQTPGGWGGFIVLGNAPINQSGKVYIEGINASTVPDGVDVSYGGTDANDNSGKIQYVRVEYAGANVSQDNELNSFTFGGVGAGTTLDHCQAYYGEDDAFEFFGGTVNAKYLVSTSTHDDAFDFDFGYNGKLQFLVATVDATSTYYTSNPNGIECDNDGTGTDATPKTHPVISNLTIRGAEMSGAVAGGGVSGYLKDGAHFRRNCGFTLVNSIIYGYPYGVELQGASSEYTFKNNVIQGWTAAYKSSFGADDSNIVVTDANYGLTTPWGVYDNDAALMPNASPANTGVNFSDLDSWFTTTTYKGAVGGRSNWLTQAWVR